jgi:hypothetical protein
MTQRNNRINENTAAIHRASVSKAFKAKPAPAKPAEPDEKKSSQAEADAAELQASLGSDVVVKPQMKAKGGVIKSSASKRADGCAVRGKTRA